MVYLAVPTKKGLIDMGFKRAEWHSGLTYQQTCRECKTPVQYNDYSLDFRPWYADGFVYCPKCKTPLRHNENYAINAPAASAPVVAQPVQPTEPANTELPRFCSICGKAFREDDNFCSGCGTKRV